MPTRCASWAISWRRDGKLAETSVLRARLAKLPPKPKPAEGEAATQERGVGSQPDGGQPGKSGTVQTVTRTLALGRGHVGGFVVALLVSLGTAASLFEPWIYRAIVDDIAGVFVRPAARVERSFEHLGSSAATRVAAARASSAPRSTTRAEGPAPAASPPRTTPQAVATVILGALLAVLVRAVSLALRRRRQPLDAALGALERNFILRTFHHVLRLPLDFFAPGPAAPWRGRSTSPITSRRCSPPSRRSSGPISSRCASSRSSRRSPRPGRSRSSSSRSTRSSPGT